MKPYYFFLCFIAIFLISCSEDTDTLSPDPLNPDQETFTSSLFIEVFNTNGQPMSNAEIKIGNTEGKTNQDGFLFLHDVVVGKSSYLTAEKDGYFSGSRRFYPSAGKSQYIKIILLSNSRDAFFNSDDGGTLPVDGGVILQFPKDGYEYENGDLYNGIVVVSVEAITADDPDLSFKMPGDLLGFREDNTSASLASFGMVAVKLNSADGESLALKPGTEVEMKMTVPADMLDNAPSTIPMWHFDEQVGIWKEEGLASLTGDQYTAQVTHFSFWNWDVPLTLVDWGASFNYEDGAWASHLLVCITHEVLNTTRCDYTNQEGVVLGIVPANEKLRMDVLSKCEEVIYSQNIGPYSENTMIGPVSIPYGNIIKSSISGNAVNCSGGPVTKGYVILDTEDYHQYYQLNDADGSFNGTIINCSEKPVQVSIKDNGNNKVSIPVSFDYAAHINAGSISVCEDNLEFIDLRVGGFQGNYIFDFPEVSNYEGGLIIYVPDSSDLSKAFEIRFECQDEPGTYDVYFSGAYVTLPNGRIAFANDEGLKVTISSFGPPGDFIRGTLTGVWYEEAMSNPKEYPLLGSFAVLREK